VIEEIKNTESENDEIFKEVTDSFEDIESEEIKIEETENPGTKLERNGHLLKTLKMKILLLNKSRTRNLQRMNILKK